MNSERRFKAFAAPAQPQPSVDPAGMILATGVAIDPEGRRQIVMLVREWDDSLHVGGRRWYKLTEVTLGQWAVPHLLDTIDRALRRAGANP